MIMVVAIPGLNTTVMGTQLPAGVGVTPIAYSWAAIWIYNELRKWYARRHHHSLFKRLTAW